MTGPPSGPPTGPPSGPPAGPPSGPPTGPPAGPPSGPPSGPPTGPPRAPAGPPPGPAAPPPAAGRPRAGLAAWAPLAALAAVVLLIIGFVVVTNGNDSSSSSKPGEVFLDPVSAIGALPPFTPDLVPKASIIPIGAPKAAVPKNASSSAVSKGPPVSVPTVSGSTPGLYGGTNQLSVCDAKQLVSFLTANPDKAKAWADAEGIRVDEIASYVGGLTDVILQGDTRVTNHGFKNGKANPIQSVLERGTAVLVDSLGVPRVRCKCGNPLTPPVAVSGTPTFSGESWEGFDPATVVAVAAAPQPIPSFTLANLEGGAPVTRTPGVDVSGAGSSSSSSSSASSSATTTTTTAPTTTTGPVENITAAGNVTASSTYSSQYPASLAVDGDITTSWFSAGANADGNVSQYRWSVEADSTITRIRIVGNGNDADPTTRNGFGFDSVTIQVFDAGGANVFSQDVQLPGTPDPDVVVTPNAVGSVVVLLFNGHEDPSCGGFAELEVDAHA